MSRYLPKFNHDVYLYFEKEKKTNNNEISLSKIPLLEVNQKLLQKIAVYFSAKP